VGGAGDMMVQKGRGGGERECSGGEEMCVCEGVVCGMCVCVWPVIC
jgi:hypothetical protein